MMLQFTASRFYLLLLFTSLCSLLPPASAARKSFGTRHKRGTEDVEAGQLDMEMDSLRKGSHLLFTKDFRNKFFAVGWEMMVRYRIYNVGSDTATNIQVEDPDFPEDSTMFLAVKEPVNKTHIEETEGDHVTSGWFDIRSLSPMQNATFILTLMPQEGPLELAGNRRRFQPAKILYQRNPDDDEDNLQIGWSSISHEDVKFLSGREADRHYRTKTVEIVLLLLMMIPPVFFPFILWKKNVNKYNALQKLVDERRGRARKSKTA